MDKAKIVKEIVEYFNPDMGGKWDTQMYRQKEDILSIIKNNSK